MVPVRCRLQRGRFSVVFARAHLLPAELGELRDPMKGGRGASRSRGGHASWVGEASLHIERVLYHRGEHIALELFDLPPVRKQARRGVRVVNLEGACERAHQAEQSRPRDELQKLRHTQCTAVSGIACWVHTGAFGIVSPDDERGSG